MAATVIAYDDAGGARTTVQQLIDIGATHIVLALPPPLPRDCVTWVANEIITPVLSERRAA